MIKHYESFEDIDNRLKILKLQREIDQENLKLHLQHTKKDLVPRQFRQMLGTSITQNQPLKNILISIIAKKILDMLHRIRQKKEEKHTNY